MKSFIQNFRREWILDKFINTFVYKYKYMIVHKYKVPFLHLLIEEIKEIFFKVPSNNTDKDDIKYLLISENTHN